MSKQLMSESDGEQRFDARFVGRLQRRDEQAFNQLVLAYEARVYRLAWRMLGSPSEAEDLTQEVFVQVFRSVHAFRGDAQLGTWIYRITANLAKNRAKYLTRRRQGRHDDVTETEGHREHGAARGLTSGEATRPDEALVGSRAERAVLEALQELDPDYRQLLVLRDVEGLSYEEVASITGLTAGTLKSRLHRARSLLREAVEARLGETLG